MEFSFWIKIINLFIEQHMQNRLFPKNNFDLVNHILNEIHVGVQH